MHSKWDKIRVFVYHDSRVKSTTKSQDASHLLCCQQWLPLQDTTYPLCRPPKETDFPANPVSIGQNFRLKYPWEAKWVQVGKYASFDMKRKRLKRSSKG